MPQKFKPYAEEFIKKTVKEARPIEQTYKENQQKYKKEHETKNEQKIKRENYVKNAFRYRFSKCELYSIPNGNGKPEYSVKLVMCLVHLF